MDIKRAHLQGEPSVDDLGLLHQTQGFARQAGQSLAVVDQSLELRGPGMDGPLHAAQSPQRDPPQPHPAQQAQAPWGRSQRPEALRYRAETQQHCGQANQPRHVPERGEREGILTSVRRKCDHFRCSLLFWAGIKGDLRQFFKCQFIRLGEYMASSCGNSFIMSSVALEQL